MERKGFFEFCGRGVNNGVEERGKALLLVRRAEVRIEPWLSIILVLKPNIAY